MRAVAIAALQQVLEAERSPQVATRGDRWLDRPSGRPQVRLTDG
jgi:hypothetical protein